MAIDASSGDVRWRATGGNRRPAVHDGTVYTPSFSDGLIGYDIETGAQTFSIDTTIFRPLSVTAAPSGLVVGTDSGLAGVSYEGATRWQYAPTDLNRDRGAIAVANGTAYAGFSGDPNQLVAVDTGDGHEQWRTKTAPDSTPQFAPPSEADGIVYFPTEDQGIAAVDATDGHVRWRFSRTRERFFGPWSPTALVDETLYFVGNGHLYALEEA
jgi:outer membrane protein assembly factor BamB